MIFVLECVLLTCKTTDVRLYHKSMMTNTSWNLYCFNILTKRHAEPTETQYGKSQAGGVAEQRGNLLSRHNFHVYFKDLL